MVFNIKHFDNILITFEYIDEGIKGQRTEIVYYDDTKKDLFPIGLELTNDGIMSWLKRRIVPKNREYVDALLAKMGLSHSDTIAIIKISKGLSLIDSYWVVEDDFVGLFENFNLFENKFEKTLSLIAYTGYGSIKAKGFTSSPEFTTNGMLKKCWRRKKDGRTVLYKGGTSGGANTGKEPYSEFYASQIAKAMELNHITYNLSIWKGELCSACEIFTNKNISYVQIYDFVGSKPIYEVGEFLKTLGDDFYNDFVDMIIFDCVVCNEDRHYGNFGLLVDSNTNKPIRLAPIFDNGISLFNYAMPDDYKNLDEYAKTRISSYNIDFISLAKEFITLRQKAKLRKLINFKFIKYTHRGKNKVSATMLKSIEKFIQGRVTELLELEVHNG